MKNKLSLAGLLIIAGFGAAAANSQIHFDQDKIRFLGDSMSETLMLVFKPIEGFSPTQYRVQIAKANGRVPDTEAWSSRLYVGCPKEGSPSQGSVSYFCQGILYVNFHAVSRWNNTSAEQHLKFDLRNGRAGSFTYQIFQTDHNWDLSQQTPKRQGKFEVITE